MANDNGPKWSVTAQREDMQLGPTGQLVAGVVVTFQTASGAIGSVFVPQADFSVEKVRAVVDAKARQVEAVQNLAG